ncbi:MAG: permease [Klebsiella pneumoniae]|nr:permease [Klebsiella pneumoniae]MDU7857655.1 permease [Klebsiella pneumoniae]
MREILISESAWEEMTCLFAPSLKEVNPQQATKLSNDFNALVRAASQYNSVREKVADPTRLGIDSMYQFKSIKLCADIQKTLIDSLVQRGESKQP